MSGREPAFRDGLFRRKAKKGAYRVVEPPVLGASLADSHAHVQLLPDPAYALARCALRGIGFVCTVVDVAEEAVGKDEAFERMDAWLAEAAAGEPFAWAQRDDSETAAVGRGASCDAVDSAGGHPDGEALGDADAARAAYAALRSGAAHVPDTRIAVGCHPHAARLYDDALEGRLRDLLRDPRVCAVGEVGLDYYYDLSPRQDQLQAFRRQVRLAHELDLPLMLHVRDAHDDALAVLREEGFPSAGTLLHCCSVGPHELEPWLEADCYVAFGGALTFGRSEDVRASARIVPDDRLLVETDAPYMTPEPMRGTTCWPDHTVFTAARLAEVRGSDDNAERAQLARLLLDNARRLLDRAPKDWQEVR